MEYEKFGPLDVSIPVLGQGTWQIRDNDSVVSTLLRGIELGMTHIDTAELYTGAEEVISRVLPGRRNDLFLVSKVMPENASRQGTVMACQRSLKRLGTDYLDCYLLHWESHVPIEETMDGMRELYHSGRIRSVGVSNFDVGQMEAAQHALGDVPLACNQVIYHLGNRTIERDVIPWCVENNVALVGYSPFRHEPCFELGTPEYDVLARIGERHGKSIRQVILRFLTRSPEMFAIPKASSVPHVEENVKGQGFTLTAEDLADIEMAFPV